MTARHLPILMTPENVRRTIRGEKWQTRRPIRATRGAENMRCPYGGPGDLLYVKETFYVDHVEYDRGPLPPREYLPDNIGAHLYYRADGACCDQIPECQCKDDSWHTDDTGARYWRDWGGWYVGHERHNAPSHAFRALWDAISARRGYGWDTNCWVWVIEYSVHEVKA